MNNIFKRLYENASIFKNDYKKTSYIKKLVKKQKKIEKKIFLFGIPNHTNLGDNAQTYCILKWCESNYPDYSIFAYTSEFLSWKKYLYLRALSKKINTNDIILFQSGYNTTDIYCYEEFMHRKVIELFKKNFIVALPQTVKFIKEEEKQKTAKVYNSHSNIIFFARDKESYSSAKEMFTSASIYLFPDIVTSLIGKYYFNNKRDGILFCMRNDLEAFISKEKITEIRNELEEKYPTNLTDTTLNISYEKLIKNKGKVIEETIKEYSSYKLMVTDRYHGIILALAASTPVIVLKTSDHKLTSGVEWFINLEQFKDYIYYCENLEDLKDVISKVIDIPRSYHLHEYFNTQYYDKLKDIIEKRVSDNGNM
jgi:exopolysaccharide biosynthesis predicted pyruvyltransferase EpsI